MEFQKCNKCNARMRRIGDTNKYYCKNCGNEEIRTKEKRLGDFDGKI